MNLNKVPVGANPPQEVNVVIEVPLGSEPIKYEIDKASGALMVDRFLYTAMHYPCNYGFIPNTLSDDGDPIDVMVYGNRALTPGCIISVRPIGVLIMEDEAGQELGRPRRAGTGEDQAGQEWGKTTLARARNPELDRPSRR